MIRARRITMRRDMAHRQETHTVISGTFIMKHDGGERKELRPGSFNYMPAKLVQRGWSSPMKAIWSSSRSMPMGFQLGGCPPKSVEARQPSKAR